jgi:hypothetical protein
MHNKKHPNVFLKIKAYSLTRIVLTLLSRYNHASIVALHAVVVGLVLEGSYL